MAVEHVGIKNFDGTEENVAVDTVDGNQIQIVKIGLGADGVLDVVVDSGPQDAADSIPVALSTEDNAALDAIESALTKSLGLSSTGTDTTLTLTSAATAYDCPASSVPASPYTLILYNPSDTDVYCRFTTGTTGGFRIDANGGAAVLELGANQVVYCYSAGAGKIINVSYKIK